MKATLRVLTPEQKQQYENDGFVIVENALSAEEVAEVGRVTDEYIAAARGVTQHDDTYDLEDEHTPENPRVRRLKEPDRLHPVYARLVSHPRIVGALQDLWGPNVRFQFSKLNMKSAGFGAAVEWHQDWAFYPHTNDDLAAVGIMLDDCELENGPLMILPGSHKGPILDHHDKGRFVAAINPETCGVDFSQAVPLTGKAGSITIHHVRALHGSAPNLSPRDRRLMLYQYAAADAWPLRGVPNWEAYERMMVSGESTLIPRLANVPVRLPYPASERQGSIYENQAKMPVRYFQNKAT